MGRSIIAEEHVEKYIDSLIKENKSVKWYVGVIIGQLTAQKDYVVHMARTPDPVEDEVSEENVEDDVGDAAILNKKAKTERPATLVELDERWVSTHAKQVSRMLPGGLSVVGLFALAPTTMLKEAQTKLRQMLFTVHKTLTKNSAPVSVISDRILLQVDLSTRKMTCSTVDIADVKSGLSVAEWKVQSGGSRWVRLTSTVNMDLPIVVPSTGKPLSLLKQIQTGLSDFSGVVNQSIVSIDRSLRDASEPLVTGGEKKAKGGKGKGAVQDTATLSKAVNVYFPFPNNTVRSSPEKSESQVSINMMGTIAVRAYVNAKATVGDAIQAVRTDILRSVHSRCELLCEEFDVVEAGKPGAELYDPPVRIFSRLHNVEVCDYVFQDEKKSEVEERMRQLLDVPEISGLEEVEKNAAEDDTWSQSSLSAMSSHQSLAAAQPDTAGTQGKVYLGAAVGGIMAVAASLLSYLYISDNDRQ